MTADWIALLFISYCVITLLAVFNPAANALVVAVVVFDVTWNAVGEGDVNNNDGDDDDDDK